LHDKRKPGGPPSVPRGVFAAASAKVPGRPCRRGPWGNSIAANFTATPQYWSFITNTIALSNPGQMRQVRFEIYIQTPFTWLLVDSANAF